MAPTQEAVESVQAAQEQPALAEKAASTTTSHGSEEYTIVHTGPRKKTKKTVHLDDDEEPLNDTTATLEKKSKKTGRLQKKLHKKQQKISTKVRNFLDLPAELLEEILGHLRPSDIFRVALLNHATREFVIQHETPIAKDIMDRRYWVLSRCFPLPVALKCLDGPSRAALLNPNWQEKTNINTKPYFHIKPLDQQRVCSCMSCLQAWNSLNILLDFAHFQHDLDNREPIPMIPRGTNPEWNSQLTGTHARIVEKAMSSPLTFAAILEKHLKSIVGTLLRQARFPPSMPMHRHNKAAVPAKTVHPIRLYHISEKDAAREDDSFLERDGKPSYELPFHRDNYYSLLAYVPNRKRSKEEQRWMYYDVSGAHARDIEWIRRFYMPGSAAPQVRGQEEFVASFRKATTT